MGKRIKIKETNCYKGRFCFWEHIRVVSGCYQLPIFMALEIRDDNILMGKPLQPTEANSLLNLSWCKTNPSRNTVHKIHGTECSRKDKNKIYLFVSTAKANTILGCVIGKSKLRAGLTTAFGILWVLYWLQKQVLEVKRDLRRTP